MLLPFSRLLPIIILSEGFVSIAIEILIIRQLLPVAGGSVIVTSLIIGFFLLFLALGYQRGGNIQKNPQKTLRNNFFIAAIWLGIGLSYFFITLFFYGMQRVFGHHIIYPLIAYLLLIIAPLIYLLGQTIPTTMHMMQQNLPAGTLSGNTLWLSTLGSFLGAIITTLVFIYFLGVAWTVFLNFILLVLLSLSLTETRIDLFLHMIICTIITALIYFLNVKIENNIFLLTNNYGNYAIENVAKEHQQGKLLIINQAFSSYVDDKNKGFAYIELIKKILFTEMQLQNADILVLGAGGFSLSAESNYHNRFTYVDIDSQIKKITVPKFIPQLNDRLVIDDARHFLQTTAQKYHVIVSDTYSDIHTFPAHLLTREYMENIQKKLTENGTAIFNMIANPGLADPYSKRVDNTIRSVFQNCMVIPVSFAKPINNIIYVCHNTPNQQDKIIYSDNHNNSTLDSFNW